jgi:pilus assembly protein Flp/PilA
MRGAQMLKQIGRLLVHILKDEDGPTAVEYAVMLALIIVVCIASIQQLGRNVDKTCDTVRDSMKSGS